MLVIYFRWIVTGSGGFDTMAYEGSLPVDELIARMNEFNLNIRETYYSWRLF